MYQRFNFSTIGEYSHQGKFPVGLNLKVQFGMDSTKSSVTFLVLFRENFISYHPKAYLYGFILSLDMLLILCPLLD